MGQAQGYLWGVGETVSHREMGQELGMSEGAVKVAVHRLRGRYRELLLAEIARTVSSPADVEEELRHLLRVVST